MNIAVRNLSGELIVYKNKLKILLDQRQESNWNENKELFKQISPFVAAEIESLKQIIADYETVLNLVNNTAAVEEDEKDSFNLLEAIDAMRNESALITRKDWEENVWVRWFDPYLDKEFFIQERELSVGTLSCYVMMHTTDNKLIPWIPNTDDLLHGGYIKF